MVKIEFKITDDFGNIFSQSNEVTLYPDIGNDMLDEIGNKLNTFMRQIGYAFDKDTILIESLTEEESDYLIGCLEDFRKEET